MTKREILFIKGYFNVMKKHMEDPPTRKKLIQYGYYAGRFYEILFRRVNLAKPDGTDDYIKETFGDEIFQWFTKWHKDFVEKEGQAID